MYQIKAHGLYWPLDYDHDPETGGVWTWDGKTPVCPNPDCGGSLGYGRNGRRADVQTDDRGEGFIVHCPNSCLWSAPVQVKR